MVKHAYYCDLCGESISTVPSSGQRPAVRLRWHNDRLYLCSLTDSSASEKAICGACLNALKEALK